VPAPVRPTTTEPLDGSARLVHTAAEAPRRAAADVDTVGLAAAPDPAPSLRVDGTPPADRGVFETVIGALIGFLFG
jgi:hypothetical protein